MTNLLTTQRQNTVPSLLASCSCSQPPWTLLTQPLEWGGKGTEVVFIFQCGQLLKLFPQEKKLGQAAAEGILETHLFPRSFHKEYVYKVTSSILMWETVNQLSPLNQSILRPHCLLLGATLQSLHQSGQVGSHASTAVIHKASPSTTTKGTLFSVI